MLQQPSAVLAGVLSYKHWNSGEHCLGAVYSVASEFPEAPAADFADSGEAYPYFPSFSSLYKEKGMLMPAM